MPKTRAPRGPRGLAAGADRYDLYQRAVQSAEAEIDFVDRVFLKLRGRRAATLREDFCGTAITACEWVRRRPTNSALAIDLDPVPLAWGIRHNLARLSPDQRQRLTLCRGDVLRPPAPPAPFHAVLAMNFSYWGFQSRELMLRYFQTVRRALVARGGPKGGGNSGLFFLDFYGGPDAHREMVETKRIPAEGRGPARKPGFTYLWEQERYDPISGRVLAHITFRFADGTAQRRAFTYDWRVWTLPEIRDVLADAGFRRSIVYWEGDDGKGGGNGVFRPRETGEACLAFVAYVVAEP